MMKWRNITAKDLDRVITKLALELSHSKRRSPHPVYWYCLDGKKTLRITMPNIHGGSGSISTGFLKQIQNNMRVNTQQFEDLAGCPLTSEQYELIIREKLGI
jgi:hypothetical protein